MEEKGRQGKALRILESGHIEAKKRIRKDIEKLSKVREKNTTCQLYPIIFYRNADLDALKNYQKEAQKQDTKCYTFPL